MTIFDQGTPAPTARGFGGSLTLLFALFCGILVANLYYPQPLVALIGRSIGLDRAAESLLVTATQVGYALGVLLLVPLGDVVENRKLILLTMGANAVSLLGLVLVPGPAMLFVLILAVGLTASAAQMLVPLAASLAPEHERGRVVGNVMTGLLGGILLARPLASLLADLIGWRGVFAVSAALVLAATLAGYLALPRRQPVQRQPYSALLTSLGRLFLAQPILRRRGLYQAALFAAFALFWTGAPLLLLREPYGFSPAGVAVFALAGVLGVFAAPVAGRLADKGHTRIGTAASIGTVVAGFALAAFGEASLPALVGAGILVDLGVQANLVFGQRSIYALDGSIRNRLNAVYMTLFFVGGALGSALTSPVLEAWGWLAVCGLGIAFPAAALIYFVAVEGDGRG